MRKKKSRYNINGMILCGLVFFAIAGTAVCMVANGKEAAVEREKAEAERKEQEAKTAEEEAAEKAAVYVQMHPDCTFLGWKTSPYLASTAGVSWIMGTVSSRPLIRSTLACTEMASLMTATISWMGSTMVKV